MTKEGFYELAKECGLDIKNPALEDLWINRTPRIIQIFDDPIFDDLVEKYLREMFSEVAERSKKILSSFNN